MSALLYYLVIKPLSLLPFPVIYFLSDVTYVLIYKVFGYRKNVVFTNLHNSFPDKSEVEIQEIASAFYHHLCDLIAESIKVFTISEEEARKRHKVLNPELADKFFEEGKSLIFAGGHYNNWEYLTASLDSQLKHQTVGIYAPMTNKYFNDKVKSSRTKHGMWLVSTKEVKAFFENPFEIPTATLFATDQSPGSSKKAYWTTFMNQDTAVLFGAEAYARKYNYPVVFMEINKVKRGFYESFLVVVEENPQNTEVGEITEKHTRLLEKEIRKDPRYWLWSHKRWKRKRTDD